MPFEIAPQTEQEQRQTLGRIALAAIAEYLPTVPPEHFDMRKWCGTACCAIGHGVKLPEVQATGLHLAKAPDWFMEQSHFPAFDSEAVEDLGTIAIARAFGIEPYQASGLFSGMGGGSTTAEVSARIKQFLAGEILQESPEPNQFVFFSPRSLGSGRFTTVVYSSPLHEPEQKPVTQPSKKVRGNSRTGATWPAPKHAYA